MMTPTSRKRRQRTAAPPLEMALSRNVEAPGVARAAVAELCRDVGVNGSLRQTLVLLVSEVVSNAVLHSSGPADASIGLTAAIGEEAVRVTVTDAGDGFTPGRRDPSRADGGYGLYLVEKAATRWGVDPSPSTSVWFEIQLNA